MARRAAIVCTGVWILLTAGFAATPVRAQTAQGKAHFGGKPSALVSLHAALGAGQNEAAVRVTSEPGATEPFVLPAGTVLVVTDLQAAGTGAAGPRFVAACTGNVCDSEDPVSLYFDTSQQLASSLTLTSGVVFRAPPTVSCFVASDGPCLVWLYGYLAKDK